MSRDYRLYLADIRKSCEYIQQYTKDSTYERFIEERMLYDAVMFNLMIVGEAIKNIPETFRKQYPTIDWRNISRLRDIIVHRYFALNTLAVWEISQNDVPEP